MSSDYYVIAGKRVLLSSRECRIRELEEVAFEFADGGKENFYVVEDKETNMYVTNKPDNEVTVIRTCPFLE